MKSSFLFLILYLTFSLTAEAKIVTRAALDIGSGTSKITVAKVDTDKDQITDFLYSNDADVKLKKDLTLSSSEYLSEKIQEDLLAVLQKFKQDVEDFNPEEWIGVGTSVFRTAKNGSALIDRIKNETEITILLVPQVEEASIGFYSAVAMSKISPEQLISWDCGSGSFQITSSVNGEQAMYNDEFGYIPALQALYEIRKKPFAPESPNPVSKEEIIQLIEKIDELLPLAPDWVSDKTKTVVGIGGETSLFSFAEKATGQTTFSKEQVLDAIYSLCGKTDAELGDFKNPDEVIVSLALLYSTMKHAHIDLVTNTLTNGVCEGLLVRPHYWD